MKTIGRICQTGGKKLEKRYVNEDIIRSGDNYILLMDGATGLGGPESINGLTSAEWYVQEAANYIQSLLQNANVETLEIVSKLIEHMTEKIREYEQANNMKFKSYEEPSSSLIICREVEKEGKRKTQFFTLGDSSIVIEYKDGRVEELENSNGQVLRDLDEGVLKRMRELAKETSKNVLDVRNSEEIKTMLEENRAKKNTDGGYWILGTNQEAVQHATFAEKDSDEISNVMLHSDGFNYKIIGVTVEEVMKKCKTQAGLEEVQRRIREAEEMDPYANKHTRFKKGDDMAVIISDINYVKEKEPLQEKEQEK